jgi:PhnB protein
MATVSVYLNFNRNTEEAFMFYKDVFGGEFIGGISRMGEAPLREGQPPLTDEDKNLVMHVALPLMGDFVLMGTDAPESMGFSLTQGNTMYINLQPDTCTETERIFTALSQGGVVEMELQDMFWGDYFASFVDKFGVRWMLACASKT